MKLLVAFALVPLAFAQQTSIYSDSKGDLSIRATDALATALKDGYRFNIKGSVRIVSKRQGYALSADRVVAEAVKGKGTDTINEIRSAKATGRVSMDQTAGARRTNIQCAAADYKTLGDTAQVDARGGVKIRSYDSSKQQTILADGASGTAVLDRKDTKGSGYRRVTLTGSVRIEIVEAARNNSQMVFTGNQLIMDPDKITLRGNVKGQGKGQSGLGRFGPVNVLVVKLKDGKMTEFSYGKGSGE